MTKNFDVKISFTIMAVLIALVGIFQSWGVALSILNLCLISAVMSMGVNIQWGFAGLINFGVMGFLAIGGLATVGIRHLQIDKHYLSLEANKKTENP